MVACAEEERGMMPPRGVVKKNIIITTILSVINHF